MKALIAMSGGVDSSVAAKIMSDKGYECVGCTMHLYSHKDEYKTSDKKTSPVTIALIVLVLVGGIGLIYYVSKSN